MAAASVLEVTDLPEFDPAVGLLPTETEEADDVEIEIVEEQPAFLQGHARNIQELSPVRIVKNPDGSLAQVST